MRALTITTHDRFNGLNWHEQPDPRPAPGQLSIKVDHAGIGLIDALWVTGAMPSPAGFVPGIEVSGTILEAGEGAEGFTSGQRVAAIIPAGGGFAEIACAPAALTAAIPDGMSMAHASVVPVNTVTAHLALTTVARLAPGERVLVHAGTGGLGSQFAQIARELGAGRIDGVVGTPEKQRRASELGYEQTFLRDELDTIPGDAYDIVVDPVGGQASAHGFRALRGGGRLLRVGNASQAPDAAINSLAHWLESKSTVGFNLGGWLASHPGHGTDSLTWSLRAVAAGAIRVELSRTGGIEEIGDMLAALERGDTTGKLALRVRG